MLEQDFQDLLNSEKVTSETTELTQVSGLATC